MSKGKLNITRMEFSESCRKHYNLYKRTEGQENDNSRRLILFYSAECGLKSRILGIIGKNTYEELVNYCDKKKIDCGHNIKDMTKVADMEQMYSIKPIRLYNGKIIQSDKFNELWRYGAKVADENECKNAEETLKKIVEWLIVRI